MATTCFTMSRTMPILGLPVRSTAESLVDLFADLVDVPSSLGSSPDRISKVTNQRIVHTFLCRPTLKA